MRCEGSQAICRPLAVRSHGAPYFVRRRIPNGLPLVRGPNILPAVRGFRQSDGRPAVAPSGALRAASNPTLRSRASLACGALGGGVRVDPSKCRPKAVTSRAAPRYRSASNPWWVTTHPESKPVFQRWRLGPSNRLGRLSTRVGEHCLSGVSDLIPRGHPGHHPDRACLLLGYSRDGSGISGHVWSIDEIVAL